MSEDVLITTEGAVGRIRLNRPKAIHALTTGMCEVMSAALLKWQSDAAVEVVIIDHAEGRGFCAGGDVVMLARSGNRTPRTPSISSSPNIGSTTCCSPIPSRRWR